MKKVFLITLAAMTLFACNNAKKAEKGSVFYTDYDTPYQTCLLYTSLLTSMPTVA